VADISANGWGDDRRFPPSPPVLVVIFNRPDAVAQLVAVLRSARPAHLFVAADGPRSKHPADAERCRAARAVFDQIDWPCEVTRRYLDRNLGLQSAMVEAIDWFFAHVDAGVILEDDCLVHPDFFTFSADLLERYRDEERVMGITSLNMAPSGTSGAHSYFFASAGHIWGWATWRRAWIGLDTDLRTWPTHRDRFLDGATPLQLALARKFDAAHDGSKYTWARAWHHHVAAHSGLIAVPSVNLVRNVGLGADATHTTSTRHALSRLPVGRLSRPLDHPQSLVPDAAYDAHLTRFHTWTRRRRLRERARSIKRSIRRRSA
jgi:hypothetical protein